VEILIKGVAVRGHTVDDGSPLTAIKAQLVVGTRSGEKISFTINAFVASVDYRVPRRR